MLAAVAVNGIVIITIITIHRILNLDESDPVYIAFNNMMSYHKAGEENWWSGVAMVLEKYDLPSDINEIKTLSKDVFRAKVNKTVTKFAFNKLVSECHAQKKTANLTYATFNVQEYLTTLYPSQSKVIFKCRSETIDIKSHLTHKYNDRLCRKCGVVTEELHHIINCGKEELMEMEDYINIEHLGDQSEVNLKLMANRIITFIEGVTNK